MYEQQIIDKLDELHLLIAKSEINSKSYKKASAILLEVKQVLRQPHDSWSLPDYVLYLQERLNNWHIAFNDFERWKERK